MKTKSSYLIFLLLISCHSVQEKKITEDKTIDISNSFINQYTTILDYYSNHDSTTTETNKYYFCAVSYSYVEYLVGNLSNNIHKTLVSEIKSSNRDLSEEEKYHLMDVLSNDPIITATAQVQQTFNIDDRKVYTFNTYVEASKYRQQVIKYGIQESNDN